MNTTTAARETNQNYRPATSQNIALVVIIVVLALFALLAYKIKPPPPEQHQNEIAEDEEGLRSTLRERKINFRNMSLPLQIVVVLVCVQLIIAAAVLISLRVLPLLHLPQAPLFTFDSGLGRPFQISEVIFIACFISLLLAWSFVLAGALHGHWLVRLIVLAGFSWEISSVLIPGIAGQLQLILLVLVWLWGLLIWFRNVPTPQRENVGRRRWRIPFVVTFVFVLLVLLINYILIFLDSFFLQIITGQLLLLLGLLFPVIILTGTDFAEFGEAVAKSVISMFRRVNSFWLLGILVTLIAITILIYALSQIVSISNVPQLAISLLWLLPPGFIVAAVLILVVRWFHIKNWSVESAPHKPSHLLVPFWALATSALFPAIAMVIAAYVVIVTLTLPINVVYIAWQGTLIAVPIILGITGLVLMWRQRHRGGSPAAAGLFFVTIFLEGMYALSLGSVTAIMARFTTSIGLQVEINNDPLLVLHSIQVVVAAATLATLLGLIIRRDLQAKKAIVLLKQLFVLNGGLQIIAFISALFSIASSLSEHYIIFEAILLVLALLWDFFMSGKEITNPDEPRFPRYARVLLYGGYIILVSTAVLFASNLVLNTGGPVESYLKFSTEIIAQAGLLYLGVPLLVTNFVLELTARWEKSSPVTSSESEFALQGQPIALYDSATRYGRLYGLRAGGISLCPVIISGAVELAFWQAIIQFKRTDAPKYMECMLHHGVGACQLSRAALLLAGGIELLYYGTMLLAFLLTLVVYGFSGLAAARESNRLRTGIKAALVAALVSSLLFILGDITALALGVNPQVLLNPLLASGNLGLSTLTDDFISVLVFDLLLLLPTLVAAAFVGWRGARIGVRRRRTPPSRELTPLLETTVSR